MRRLSALALVPLALAVSGCSDYMWWEYRDDPYVAAMAAEGDAEMLRNINSLYVDNRQAALHLAAFRAAKARRSGYFADAERLEGIIIRRYQLEKDPAVRLYIVRICAPLCGTGSSAMVRFLRARIAAGEYPGHAALSLAELKPRGAAADILPLTRHPAPEVRYQAATALTVLGNPAGYAEVARVWRSMDAQYWPPTVDGMPLDEARSNLEKRAGYAFGRRLR